LGNQSAMTGCEYERGLRGRDPRIQTERCCWDRHSARPEGAAHGRGHGNDTQSPSDAAHPHRRQAGEHSPVQTHAAHLVHLLQLLLEVLQVEALALLHLVGELLRLLEVDLAGAKAVNPNIVIDVKYLTEPPDFSGFNSVDKGKAAAEGWWASNASPDMLSDPKDEAWITKFKTTFKRDPINYSITAYHGVLVIADAVERTVKANKPLTRSNVRDAIQATSMKNTLQGAIEYDENGDIKDSLDLNQTPQENPDKSIRYVNVKDIALPPLKSAVDLPEFNMPLPQGMKLASSGTTMDQAGFYFPVVTTLDRR